MYKQLRLFSIVSNLYKSNKGISKTLKLIGGGIDEKIDDIDEEALDNLDSDFMNARDIKEYHEREIHKWKNKIDLKKTEHKFFRRAKNPNMLTWAEKEQIRKLNYSEPQIWTLDKLSMSFPATPFIIQKILRNSWKPESSERVKKHDEVVADNWKKFQKGTLKIEDPALLEHLKTFSSREKLVLNNNVTGDVAVFNDLQESTKVNEFSSIVSEYQNKFKGGSIDGESKPTENLTLPALENKQSDTCILPPSENSHIAKRNRLYTLETLRKKVELSVERQDSISKNDEVFLRRPESSETLPLREIDEEMGLEANRENMANPLHDKMIHRYKVGEVTQIPEIENIPLKITIPKEKWKSGGTYKVSDCYYNCEGEFLYRVPGMIS